MARSASYLVTAPMPRFSTALKLAQVAMPLNMLVVLALVFIFASGLTPELIPWGAIALDLLLVGTLIVDFSALVVMPVHRRAIMRLIRRTTLGANGTIAIFLVVVSIAVATGIEAVPWRELFSWQYELVVGIAIALNMSLLASLGRH